MNEKECTKILLEKIQTLPKENIIILNNVIMGMQLASYANGAKKTCAPPTPVTLPGTGGKSLAEHKLRLSQGGKA